MPLPWAKHSTVATRILFWRNIPVNPQLSINNTPCTERHVKRGFVDLLNSEKQFGLFAWEVARRRIKSSKLGGSASSLQWKTSAGSRPSFQRLPIKTSIHLWRRCWGFSEWIEDQTLNGAPATEESGANESEQNLFFPWERDPPPHTLSVNNDVFDRLLKCLDGKDVGEVTPSDGASKNFPLHRNFECTKPLPAVAATSDELWSSCCQDIKRAETAQKKKLHQPLNQTENFSHRGTEKVAPARKISHQAKEWRDANTYTVKQMHPAILTMFFFSVTGILRRPFLHTSDRSQ